ncbi:MAG: indole-3-glycerol phosphate synthase TrpC [Planctomycetota bacterium]
MTILDDILVKTKETIQRDAEQVPAELLESQLDRCPTCLDFFSALAAGDGINVIAEVKRASPSAGLIREDFDPVEIAKSYVEGGASCLSVLTDEPFFQGSLEYLKSVRQAVDVPLLRKDFIVDRYQLLQARVHGADCVLLIAECLSADELRTLHDQAIELGMQTLIELYEPSNLEAVLATGTKLVGINNRNLKTFETKLQHTLDLRPRIPNDCLVVGESGIRSNEDMKTLAAGGVKAVLVGESLMRQPNVSRAVKELLGR